MMDTAKRLVGLAKGELRYLSGRELAERDFPGFMAWLKEQGWGDPYMAFSREAWHFARLHKAFNAYLEQQEAAKKVLERREQDRVAIINALQDPELLTAVVVGLPEEKKAAVRTLLTPAPSAGIPEEVLPPGLPGVVAPMESDA